MELKSRFCKESMMVEKLIETSQGGNLQSRMERVSEKTGSLIHGDRHVVIKYNGHQRGFEDNRSL